MILLAEIREDIAKILLHLIIYHLDIDIEQRLNSFPVNLSSLKIDK